MLLSPSYTMLASVSATLVLSLIYFVLYRQARDAFILLWGAAWVSYALMFAADLLNFTLDVPRTYYILVRQLTALGGSFLFLSGTLRFLDFREPKFLRPAAALSAVTILAYGFFPSLIDLLLVPNIALLSLMLIMSGCLFLARSWTKNVPERTSAGSLILLWGIFINHFSFTYKAETIALLSYYIELVIVNLLIVMMMIIYFRKVRYLDQKKSERFRLLVENSASIMFLYSYEQHRFEYVSPSITPLIGTSAEHLYLDPDSFFEKIAPDEESQHLLDLFRRPVNKPGYGLVTRSQNGAIEKWCAIHYVPIVDNTGIVTAVEGLVMDITEQTRAAQEIAAAEKAKQEFLQDISHEIKTPITVITGYTESLLEDLVPRESTDTYIKLIHSKALLLDNLLDDLASATDFSSQTMEYKFYETNALEFFTLAVEEARIQITDAGHEANISFNIDSRAVVIIDTARITQVISNLISNAMRHTPEGGAITITCRSYHHEHLMHIDTDEDIPRGNILFSVQDTGNGIPENDLPHIFERNYSGKNRDDNSDHPSTDMGRKTGLGLFISRQIISQHSGSITAHNVSGSGAEFTFQIPYYL